jgi:hypothetical protein
MLTQSLRKANENKRTSEINIDLFLVTGTPT